MACIPKPSADGTRFAYVRQTDCETIPANPNLQIIGITAETMSGNIGNAESSEIYSDRNARNSVRVSSDVGGEISVEWRVNALSEFIVAGLQSNDADIVVVDETTELTVTQSSGVVVATTVDTFADVNAGYFVRLGGFVDVKNNVVVRVMSKTDNQTITVQPAFGGDLADEVSATGTVKMWRCVNGQTPRFYLLEKAFTDMATPAMFRYYSSQVSTLNFTFGSQSILTGSVGFIGQREEVSEQPISGSSYLAPSNDPILDTTTAVGDLWFNDALTTYDIMELTIGLNNNSRGQTAIGSEGYVGVAHGECTVSGSMSTYFETLAQYQMFLNQERVNIDMPIEDADKNAMIFSLSSVKHLEMNVNATGKNSDVMSSGNYKAHINTGAVETLAVTFFEAPIAIANP